MARCPFLIQTKGFRKLGGAFAFAPPSPGLMGQGLEIVQECWVREEREQLLTTEHQEHTTPRVVRVRRFGHGEE